MSDLFRLDGKVAVVIGGGGGLGEPIAVGFAQQGAKVIVASRTLDKVEKAAERIKKEAHSDVLALQFDATDEQSVIQLVKKVVDKFGRVDILMNAHGTAIKGQAAEYKLETWNEQFKLNCNAIMLPCREFGKVMMQQKKGKIINMSSERGSRCTIWPGNIAYSASKGAVEMYTKALASEWAPYNINVNAIAPSIIRTPLTEALGILSKEHLDKYLVNCPLKRIGEPQDIKGVSIFLASAASDFITGHIIYLDGGMHIIS